VEYNFDNMLEIGNHLSLTSQGYITARSQSGSSHADHVPGGIIIKHAECSCRYNEHIREHAAVRSVHQGLRTEKKYNWNPGCVHRLLADTGQQP
jgi:hypothetical protein